MANIKKFNDFQPTDVTNEHLFSGAEEKDASIEDMERVIVNIIQAVKNGAKDLIEAAKEIKNLKVDLNPKNAGDNNYPLAGAQQ